MTVTPGVPASPTASSTPATRTALVVDDEPALAQTMVLNLRARGWQVLSASDGTGALRAVAERSRDGAGPIDVVVLDLGLPDLDGIEVIRSLRAWSSVPIIVLSARRDSTDKVAALDAGADDYVTKPFGMDELLARLRAAVRRGRPTEDDAPVVVAGDLTIDLPRRRVLRAGVEVRLTPTEWSLLEVLVRHRGQLVPGRQLLAEVWGPSYRTETNYLRVYSAQLRRKLEADPAAPAHLITEPGMGYRFEV